VDAKEKRLKLMRFWLFGSFVIIWAAVTAYIGLFTGNPLGAIMVGFPIWGVAAVTAIVLYFVYKAILNRPSGS
jgi:hypothetical protein